MSMNKLQTKTVDGKASIEALSTIVCAHNSAQTLAKNKLRGNTLKVAKRCLYDFRNAFNKGKVFEKANAANAAKLPYLVSQRGEWWLVTANALIAHVEEGSLTTKTVARCLERLAGHTGDPFAGLIVEDLKSGPQAVLEGLGNVSANDIAIKLNPKVLAFQETKTNPQHPPNKKGKADIARAASKSSEGEGIPKNKLNRLVAKYSK